VLPDGTAVQRTFLTGRSVELDAVVLLGRPAPAADALPARDSKAGDDLATSLDPRVGLMLEEAFRHCKVLGGLGAGRDALAEAGYTDEWDGVLVGDDADEFVDSLLELMSHHRAWERFATSVTG
jgi:catalase